MKLFSVAGNSQKLDGGAMFGNAPKALWQRWYDCDADNRIHLQCRCLLVQESNRNILFETGVGAFFSPELKTRYGIVEQEHRLLESLADIGLQPEDIDLIVLSHLHFDHAGGLLTSYSDGEALKLVFNNAKVIVSESAWQRAANPHPRDRASFIPGLTELLSQSGRLIRVSEASCDELGAQYRFHYSNGHTPGMLMTEIDTGQQPLVFAADLIPGTAWMHLPITMGYDRYPEQLIDEKQSLLNDLHERQGRIFFTHDPKAADAAVMKSDKGRFSAADVRQALRPSP